MDQSRVGRVIVITGAMAAGKSTVAELLASRLPRSVHVRGDAFRRMVVNGRADITPELTDEAADQLALRYDLANIAGASVHHSVSDGDVTSQAASAVPVIITDSAMSVTRRPIRPTRRPASGEVVAAPTAKGVISRAAWSGEKPTPSCRWTDSTRKIPVKPVKYRVPTSRPLA